MKKLTGNGKVIVKPLIKKQQYVDTLFAVLANNRATTVNVDALAETINILYSSREFKGVTERLELTDFSPESVLESKYVTSDIDEKGFVKFKVPPRQAEKIMDRDPEAAVAFNNAAIKQAYFNKMMQKGNNQISFFFDDPDGYFSIPYYCEPGHEQETLTFTDGIIQVGDLKPDPDMDYKYNLDLDIIDATYTMMLDLNRGVPRYLSIRGFTLGNYEAMYNEGFRLFRGDYSGYNELMHEKPRIYQLRRQ